MSGLRVRHDRRRIDRVAHTGGRPLGLELLPDGRLLVCDAQRGLLRVDPADGRIELAVRDIAGTPMVFCNNAAVAADGTVFFSDSSTRYASRTGRRTSSRTPAPACCSGSTPTARSPSCSTGWPSRTGVALAPDELFVAVAETAARTVVRHWLSGPRAGTRDLLVGDLPRYPGDRRARARGPGVARQPGRARRRRCRTLTRIT